ncbi:MAG: glycosyltransferase family 4 protein [Kiloniellales bacterium]
MSDTIAFILKGYPRLSETFIAQEILALERRGLRLLIYSLRRPADPAIHAIHREIAAPVTYLPEYLKDQPLRVLRGWRRARRMPGYRGARRTFLGDLLRDPTPNRVRRFGQACVLATELPVGITRLHAHFLHTPGSVARYAAQIAGLPWSASAHAKDIWTTPDWELAEKLDDADWVVTCTAAGRARLGALAPNADKVGLVYHGLDLARFPLLPANQPLRNGHSPADPVILLSVGRAVEKKGYDDLLDALARLPLGLYWRFVHIGGGELAEKLKAQAEAIGLAEHIAWLGAQPQERVLAEYRRADLFVLACRVAADGDRDGLPNVLLEAQSQGLACVSTAVSGIPELIVPETTGVLVPPGDVDALATALARLISAPQERARLGAAGAERVRERFAMEIGIGALAARFGLAPASAAAE